MLQLKADFSFIVSQNFLFLLVLICLLLDEIMQQKSKVYEDCLLNLQPNLRYNNFQYHVLPSLVLITACIRLGILSNRLCILSCSILFQNRSILNLFHSSTWKNTIVLNCPPQLISYVSYAIHVCAAGEPIHRSDITSFRYSVTILATCGCVVLCMNMKFLSANHIRFLNILYVSIDFHSSLINCHQLRTSIVGNFATYRG